MILFSPQEGGAESAAKLGDATARTRRHRQRKLTEPESLDVSNPSRNDALDEVDVEPSAHLFSKPDPKTPGTARRDSTGNGGQATAQKTAEGDATTGRKASDRISPSGGSDGSPDSKSENPPQPIGGSAPEKASKGGWLSYFFG